MCIVLHMHMNCIHDCTYFTFCVVGFGTQSVTIPEGESEPLLEIFVTDGFLLNPVTVELEYISGTAEGTSIRVYTYTIHCPMK